MNYTDKLARALFDELPDDCVVGGLGKDIVFVKQEDTTFRLEPLAKHGDDEFPDVAITYGPSGVDTDVILSSPSPETVAVFTSGALSFAHSFDQTLKSHADRLTHREADAAGQAA